jgi:hypothetical protein
MVGGVDVVLDDDRNAVQRAAHARGPPLGVTCVGDGERVGIELDHRGKRGTAPIQRLDAGEVLLGNLPGRSAS